MIVRMYEGSLRNLGQLVKELGIAQGRSARETERCVIGAGFRRWGHRLMHHLHGSFAFAVWDEARKELFCARDPFGIQSMYYYTAEDGTFLYGTSLGRIVGDPAFRKSLDKEALWLYTTFGYPIGEKTLYAGVRKLMPGCTLIWDGSSVRTERWYSLSFHPDPTPSEEEWTGKIDQTLQDILSEDRSRYDFAHACSFLSGGVDSSYLLASSGTREAIGIGYAEPGFSESQLARETAERAGARFHELRISAEQFFDVIPRFLRSLELPLADASAPVFALGCEQAAKMPGPFLSGEGADEFFAGYYIYSRVSELEKAGTPYYGCDGVADPETGAQLLPDGKTYSLAGLTGEACRQAAAVDFLSGMLSVDITLWLEGDILFGNGRSARANGLDLLLPFADRRMFELSAAIPSTLKRRDGIAKYILRRAAQTRLPRETAFRPKNGFSVPARQWFRESRFRPRIEQAIFGPVSEAYFSQDMLRSIWRSFLEGNDAVWRIPYMVYIFVQWYGNCYINTSEAKK